MSKTIRERMIINIKDEADRLAGGSLSMDSYCNKLRNIFFYAKKEKWNSLMNSFLTPIQDGFDGMDVADKIDSLAFLTDLAIGLKSKLTYWHLLAEVGTVELESSFASVCTLFRAYSENGATQTLLSRIKKETLDWFKAEGIEGAQAVSEAVALIGGSLQSYVENIVALIEQSALAKQAVANIKGVSPSYIGNDYGAFPKYFMWFGASFQTTNPPLVKMAWALDDEGNGDY